MKTDLRNIIGFILLCFIFGSGPIVIKAGLNHSVPPLMFAGLRFVMSFFIMWGLIKLKGLSIPKDSHRVWQLFILGILWTAVPYALLYWGLLFVNASTASILFSSMPIFVTLIIAFYLNEQTAFSIRHGVVFLAGMAGLYFIFYDDLSFNVSFIGKTAILLSAFITGAATVYGKMIVKQQNLIVVSTFQMLAGAITLFPAGIIEIFLKEEYSVLSIPSISLWALIYLSVVCSCVAIYLYFYLLKNIGAVQLSLETYISPLITVALAIIFMNDNLTYNFCIGTILILSSIFFANSWKVLENYVEVKK